MILLKLTLWILILNRISSSAAEKHDVKGGDDDVQGNAELVGQSASIISTGSAEPDQKIPQDPEKHDVKGGGDDDVQGIAELDGPSASVIKIGSAESDQKISQNLINTGSAEPDQETFGDDHRSFIPNGECDLATSITIPYSDIGTNNGKEILNIEKCGVNDDGHHQAFYTLTVAAPTFVTATTCSDSTTFDTQLSVFTGDCESSVCFDGNDNDRECTHNALFSRVNFNAVPGETYYIVVHGYEDAIGTFELIVESATAPANDECTAAITVTVDAAQVGSTTFASRGSHGDCMQEMTMGIWYEFTPPTDGVYYATVCDPQTNYDTTMTVFKGSCAALVCVDENDDNGDCDVTPVHSHVTWDGLTTETYFIAVHGNSEVGTFELTISSAASTPVNNDCDNAVLLSLDVGNSDSNVDSIRDPTLQDCDITPNSGNWFKYTAASDSLIHITTCHNETDFDTQVVVYKGVCASLECVGGNDNDAECNYSDLAVYTWEATNAVTYFFQVSGKYGDRGNFDILVLAVPVAETLANDECNDAIVGSIGNSVQGITTYATDGDSADCSGVETFAGAWYEVTPSLDTVLIATTCFEATTFDTQITVYDSCGGNCVAANDDADPRCRGWEALSEVVWTATGGTTYKILIHGRIGQRGAFELLITEECDLDHINERHEEGKWSRSILHNENNVVLPETCCLLCLNHERCYKWSHGGKEKCKLHGLDAIPKKVQPKGYQRWMRMEMAVPMNSSP